MNRMSRLMTGIVVLMAVIVFAGDAWARGRTFHPGLGRYLQRDPNGTAIAPSVSVSAIPTRNLSAPQFTQRDPSPNDQYTDGMNLYQYVSSDPIDLLDPFGLEWKVDRNSGERRAAVTGECGDKIEDLAPLINMKPDRFFYGSNPKTARRE